MDPFSVRGVPRGNTASEMAFTRINRSEGFLKCDYPGCDETSEPFVLRVRSELPGEWVLVTQVRPERPGIEHLCPTHAPLERGRD